MRRPGHDRARPPGRHPPGPLPRRGAARRRSGFAGPRGPARPGAARRARRLPRRGVVARHPHPRRARPARPHPRPRGAGARRQPREHRRDDRAPGDRRQRRPGRRRRARRRVGARPAGRRPARAHLAVRRAGRPGRPGLLGGVAAGARAPRRGRRPDQGALPRRAARPVPRGRPWSPARCASTRGRSASAPPRPSGYLGQVRAEEVGGAPRPRRPTTSSGAPAWSSSTTPCCAARPGAPSSPSTPAGWSTGVVSRTDPVPGRDLVTSLDVRVQAAAEKALATQMAAARTRGWPADSGAVVVLDPRSGAVAALASAPAYDPNVWTGGISRADYAASHRGIREHAAALAGDRRRAGPGEHAEARLGRRRGAGRQPAERHLRLPGESTASATGSSTTTRPRGRGLISFRKAIQISCDTVFYAVAYRLVAGAGRVRRDERRPRPVRRRRHRAGARAPAPASTCPARRPGGSPTVRGRRRPGRRPRPSRAGGPAPATPRSPTAKQAAYLTAGRGRELRERLPAAPGRRRELLHRPGRRRGHPAAGRGHVRRHRQRRHRRHPAGRGVRSSTRPPATTRRSRPARRARRR